MGSFFEELGKKFSQTGQGAIEKTRQLAEVARINAQLEDEEDQLEQLYANLGKTYYQVSGKKPEILYQDLCQAIDGSLNTVKHYQETLNKLRGFKCCERCGEQLVDKAFYCSYCGQVVNETVKEQVYRVCVHCGTVSTEAEETTCKTCQKSL